MSARPYGLARRRLRWVGVLLVVVVGAGALARWTHPFCPSGSMITNPDGFASANMAAGLRAISH